jgi:NADH-quinone oxidoreductase subunit L
MRFIWEQEFIFSNEKFYGINRLELAALFFFFGAVGKSAQIGLHTWLPDAMEGPTPVSALIHAATMVTAGVFLIIRCSFLFEFSENLTFIITLTGLTTAIFAGTVACFQYDIKKIIAYSTCSQLGYMIFSCGLHQYITAFFHLLTHAFFKALLFLTAGAVIHFLGGEQDLRKMGGMHSLAPLMSTNMLIGTLALVGFPFLAGYYSKDAILENSYTIYNNLGVFVYYTALFGALITSYYSLRLYYLIYFGNNKTPLKRFNFLHKMTFFMGVSLYFFIFL